MQNDAIHSDGQGRAECLFALPTGDGGVYIKYSNDERTTLWCGFVL